MLLSPTCVGSLPAVAEQSSAAEVASDPIRKRALARLSAAFAENARDLAELVNAWSMWVAPTTANTVDVPLEFWSIRFTFRCVACRRTYDSSTHTRTLSKKKKEPVKRVEKENKPNEALSKASPAPTDSFEAMLLLVAPLRTRALQLPVATNRSALRLTARRRV